MSTSVGQDVTPYRFQIVMLASLTTGWSISYRPTLRDVLGVPLGVELGGVDADDHQFVGVLLLELGQVGQDVDAVDAAEVQKSSRTILPLRSSA